MLCRVREIEIGESEGKTAILYRIVRESFGEGLPGADIWRWVSKPGRYLDVRYGHGQKNEPSL